MNDKNNLHKKIKRTFGVSKAFGDIGMWAIGAGAVFTLVGYILSFRVDSLEKKLNNNNRRR